MKILIVSYECWRDDTNGGNVLSNIFSGIDAEYAQIYCSGGEPSNTICKKYFQITDKMIFKGKNIGREFQLSNDGEDVTANSAIAKRKTITFGRNFLSIMRGFFWNIAKWRNSKLEKFILDFQPDIIFAPCYGITHMLKLDRYVQKVAKKPMISYVSDDTYSLKRFSLSPLFWLNLFNIRRETRKTYPLYSLVYTMTNTQKEEYENYFNVPMKVLCKSGKFEKGTEKKLDKPIKMIYAGGIYIGRWKVLAKIKKSLEVLNKDLKKAELHIFTANQLSKRQKNALHDGVNSYVHPSISFAELKRKYEESHIALHVESFGLKNRLTTRLSFSTKIMDCLESGCAVLAIGPKGQAGIEYLKENDGAICVFDSKEISKKLDDLINDDKMITEYGEKAMNLGMKNHKKEDSIKMLTSDFLYFSSK